MPRPQCLHTSDSTFCLAFSAFFANNDGSLRAVSSPFRSSGDLQMTNLGSLNGPDLPIESIPFLRISVR